MKNKRGITLIALIITIITLLIMAGVSIALVVGDNGIATKATKSKVETEIEASCDEVQLIIALLRLVINPYDAYSRAL